MKTNCNLRLLSEKTGHSLIRILITFIFSAIILPYTAASQTIDKWVSEKRIVPDEKIYIHCDREFYFRKETIWFRVYLLESQTFRHKEGNENLFVDLLDDKGIIQISTNLIVSDGVASGYLFLNDSIRQGVYILRAYTDYLTHFGEDAFFYKQLKISEIVNQVDVKNRLTVKTGTGNLLTDVAFLPEGGFLLAGQSNQVAVKAVDKSGMGINVKGLVVDDSGDSIASFDTGFRGMGSFYFTPVPGKSYHSVIKDLPQFRYDFADVRNEGIKLQLLFQNNEEFVFTVVSNNENFIGRNYYLIDMNQGKVEFYKQFVLEKKYRLFRFSKSTFPGGINRLILMNSNMEPISGRLVFSDNYSVNQLVVKTDTNSYATRSEVSLKITDERVDSTEYISDYSVAVVDENSVNSSGPSQNILSWLLLSSELKGYIESPAGCFVSDSLSSGEKLDLVMLTNGWTNYLTNSLKEGKDTTSFSHTSGITLSGRVKKLLGPKPVENGEISMLVFRESDIEFLGGKTDLNGRFNFGNMFFYDTASVFIQARTEKGRKFTELFLDPVFENRPAPSPPFLSKLRSFSDIPVELFRRKYLNDIALREFYPDTNSIMLGEVEIRKQKIEKDDGHFRMYGMPDNSLKITDRDISYSSVFDYLNGRVAGLFISGSKVSIRGGGMPLFLLDGMPMEGDDGFNMLQSIPMSDIDVVDVLKNISDLAMFGSRGANGVIAVYTKRGITGTVRDYLVGALTKKIIGYQPFREFYSPTYTPENINTPEPDYRTTLYWNPMVVTGTGLTELSFYSCDEVTSYRIFVEGITTKGRICLGSGQFSVDRFREKNTSK